MRSRHLAIALTLLVALPATALAASKNGITPLTPKSGSTVRNSQPPTFKMRVKGKGKVFLHVCKSSKRDKEGVICDKELIVQAKKKGSTFQAKAKSYSFPSYWLNSPGTYYWQAYRIDCSKSIRDCKLESPVVKFKVA